MTKLTFKKGTPKKKGYYLVRCSKKELRPYKEAGKYGSFLWWNGTEWQCESDDDVFDRDGNEKPIKLGVGSFNEYCEVQVDD